MRRALIIAHEPDGVAGMVGERLEQRGFELTTHILCHDYERPDVFEPLPDFEDFDVIVPMGSIRSVYDTATIGAWIGDELEQLRKAHDRGQPILGVCFGGQALATALGGTCQKADGFEIGWYEVEVADGVPVAAGPWFEWHYDSFTTPPGAVELARNDMGPQMFLRDRSLGTQFHPEVSHAHLAGFIDNGGRAELEAKGIDPDELLAETADREDGARARCHALVDWFLDEVARVGAS